MQPFMRVRMMFNCSAAILLGLVGIGYGVLSSPRIPLLAVIGVVLIVGGVAGWVWIRRTRVKS